MPTDRILTPLLRRNVDPHQKEGWSCSFFLANRTSSRRCSLSSWPWRQITFELERVVDTRPSSPACKGADNGKLLKFDRMPELLTAAKKDPFLVMVVAGAAHAATSPENKASGPFNWHGRLGAHVCGGLSSVCRNRERMRDAHGDAQRRHV